MPRPPRVPSSPPRTNAPAGSVGVPRGKAVAVGGLLLLLGILGIVGLLVMRRPAATTVAVKKKTTQEVEKRGPAAVRVASRPRASASGHVLDLEGKPVANAHVCAWAGGDGMKKLSTSELAPRCTQSDAEGSYGLGDLFPETALAIGASAKGFAPTGYHDAKGSREVRLAAGERRLGVDLQFTRVGVEIAGVVSDITGGAVSQAVVLTGDGTERSAGVTDAKGAFSLWVAPGEVTVEASASGYAPASDSGPAPMHHFKIQLVPGGTLVGRVVLTESESPVPGVFVEGIQIEGGYTRASSFSDADGHFRVEGLPPGRYRIEATSEGREGYSRNGVTLAMGETSSEIVVPMDPAYVVKAKVVEKGTGAPCPAGTVTLTDPDQNEYSMAQIEPDGFARMASVIPGNYRVDVKCTNHISAKEYPNVVLRDRDAPPLTFEVDPGAAILVEVVDNHGTPIKDAKVSASGAAQDPSYASVDHPEADGLYHLTGLKTELSYQVSASLDEGATGHQTVKPSGGPGQRVKVEIPRAGVIEGIVEDAQHRPVANVGIQARSSSGYGYARSLEDGTFLMKNISPGDFTVRIADDGRSPAPPEDDPSVAKVTMREGLRAKIRLSAPSRSGVVAGRVVDGSDKPVTDAMVDVALSNGGGTFPRWETIGRSVMTDMDGRFTLESLPEGNLMLRASRSGGAEVVVDGVASGSKAVVMKLEGGGVIAGAVTSKGGAIERFTLELNETKTGFSREELMFHAGGTFSVGDLPPGTYKVSADTPLGHADAEVTLAAGEQRTDVMLSLALRGVVRGVARDLDTGAPVAGASVMLSGASSAPIVADGRAITTGADGSFTVERVLAGTWDLYVQPPAMPGAAARFPVTLTEGGQLDVGVVKLASPRVASGQRGGWLGFYASVSFEGDAAPVVRSVSGAAAEAGMVEGDTIVSIDGHDVQGPARYLYQPLTTVPSGTTVTVGLGRGASVRVTAM